VTGPKARISGGEKVSSSRGDQFSLRGKKYSFGEKGEKKRVREQFGGFAGKKRPPPKREWGGGERS